MQSITLPEWAGQYHSERLHILYGGFNPRWAAGALEREVVDKCGQDFLVQHPDKTIHIIVPNWYSTEAVLNHINDISADILVLCSLSDPPNRTLISTKFSQAVYQFGYTTTGIAYDFWATACFKFFKSYTEDELQPTAFQYLFLNYNRKPHWHRVRLVEILEQSGMIEHGCVTLNGKYDVGDQIGDYLEAGANDAVGTETIPNDIYSLGQLSIWNKSLINIVSETQCGNETFLSEKIYKPIIGMRPFIINGNPRIYTWLKQNQFDCFEDLFPVQEIINNPNSIQTIIVASLLKYRNRDLMQLYQMLLPRLQYNRTRFFEYAKNNN